MRVRKSDKLMFTEQRSKISIINGENYALNRDSDKENKPQTNSDYHFWEKTGIGWQITTTFKN